MSTSVKPKPRGTRSRNCRTGDRRFREELFAAFVAAGGIADHITEKHGVNRGTVSKIRKEDKWDERLREYQAKAANQIQATERPKLLEFIRKGKENAIKTAAVMVELIGIEISEVRKQQNDNASKRIPENYRLDRRIRALQGAFEILANSEPDIDGSREEYNQMFAQAKELLRNPKLYEQIQNIVALSAPKVIHIEPERKSKPDVEEDDDEKLCYHD